MYFITELMIIKPKEPWICAGGTISSYGLWKAIIQGDALYDKPNFLVAEICITLSSAMMPEAYLKFTLLSQNSLKHMLVTPFDSTVCKQRVVIKLTSLSKYA